MRAFLSTAAVLTAALQLVNAQTSTDCDPTKKTCPSDTGYGKGQTTTYDFTTMKDLGSDWSQAEGTSVTTDSNGIHFDITSKTGAPTISSDKYIFFGKVSVQALAAPGTGIVSSFILESDDLDEIDFEWVGSDDANVQSNFFGKGNTTVYDRGGTHAVDSPVEKLHTYSIEWTNASTIFSIDDKPVRTLAFDDPKALGGRGYPQTPMKVKIGSWVACPDQAAADAKATAGTCSWAGGPAVFASNTKYTYYVKSVSITDYGCGGDYTYTDMTGNWQSIKSSNTCDGFGSANGNPPSGGSSSGSSTAVSSTPTSTGSSGGSSGASSAASSAPSSSTSASGGELVQTSASSNVTQTSTASNTTLASVTSTGSPTKSSGTGASSTTSGAAQATANAASNMKPKHKYGVVDVAVIGLGLGLGYLVM